MPDRSRKRPRDVNQLAASVVAEAVGDRPMDYGTATGHGKNPAAVALGRLGGIKGGVARANSLSAEERQRIAAKAARVRWKKKRSKA